MNRIQTHQKFRTLFCLLLLMISGCSTSQQTNSNNPLLPEGTPSVSPTLWPTITQKPTQNYTPTSPPASATASVQVDLERFTYEEGYPLALAAARAWNPNAALYRVHPPADLSGEPWVNIRGEAPIWEYEFYDASAEDPGYLTFGRVISIQGDGVMQSRPRQLKFWHNPDTLQDYEGVSISAAEAIYTAETSYGELIRRRFPKTLIFPMLSMAPPDLNASGPAPHWLIAFLNQVNLEELMAIAVDATTGEISLQGSQIPDFLSSGLTPYPETQSGPGLTAGRAIELAQLELGSAAPQTKIFAVEPPDENWGANVPQGNRLNGEAAQWRVTLLASESSGQTNLYHLLISSEGTLSIEQSAASEIPVEPWLDWKLDSSEAIQTAEAFGGAEFRQRFPEASIYASLRWLKEDLADLGKVFSPQWWIRYTVPNSNIRRSYSLSAVSGALRSMRTTYGDLSQLPQITAFDAYPIAERYARGQYPQAALAYAGLGSEVYEPILGQRGLPPEGSSNLWSFIFVFPEAEMPAPFENGVYITVSDFGLEIIEPALKTDPPIGSAEIWRVDSPEAVQTCDEAGGEQYRQRYPHLVVRPELVLYKFEAAPDDAGPVLWYLNYTDPLTMRTQICWVDGVTGELLSVEEE